MKSFEELTFELLEYKEELDKAIRDYESALRKIRQKSYKYLLVILVLLLTAAFLIGSTIYRIPYFWQQGGLFSHWQTWVGVVCLLIAFFMARAIYKQENRFSMEEHRLRDRRELATTKYAELINEIDKLRAARNAKHLPSNMRLQ